MIVALIILALVFGLSKALCDISESGFATSKFKNLNPQFWDKHKSWRNKWKGGVAANGEKFFGSSTFGANANQNAKVVPAIGAEGSAE